MSSPTNKKKAPTSKIKYISKIRLMEEKRITKTKQKCRGSRGPDCIPCCVAVPVYSAYRWRRRVGYFAAFNAVIQIRREHLFFFKMEKRGDKPGGSKMRKSKLSDKAGVDSSYTHKKKGWRGERERSG